MKEVCLYESDKLITPSVSPFLWLTSTDKTRTTSSKDGGRMKGNKMVVRKKKKKKACLFSAALWNSEWRQARLFVNTDTTTTATVYLTSRLTLLVLQKQVYSSRLQCMTGPGLLTLLPTNLLVFFNLFTDLRIHNGLGDGPVEAQKQKQSIPK